MHGPLLLRAFPALASGDLWMHAVQRIWFCQRAEDTLCAVWAYPSFSMRWHAQCNNLVMGKMQQCQQEALYLDTCSLCTQCCQSSGQA